LDIQKLKELIGNLHFSEERRIRLLVDKSGSMRVMDSKLEEWNDPCVRLSSRQTDSSNHFLYHKTTNRSLYDAELHQARSEGFFDVIFSNERAEITEGAISNIFILKNAIYYTPPISCGLLPGTYRQHLLDSSRFPIKEQVLNEQDLMNADAIFVANSVRGLMKVRFTK
jgi:para-aminobenzoate synthetase/4-amino-4-deoxychorismate lyase